jgi:hypothetical protein
MALTAANVSYNFEAGKVVGSGHTSTLGVKP